ncbi:hypothetical protein EVAR_32757_1 [Eumeta japonica]|uniref:Uncharacterized protein n=1 Tax=Eumeta variegata TaxID=151549 RepID=A0A4C1XR05_EUMVA|nr:hypothetical protein EVAR_32757_1 [Eumeta japonica]
MIKVRIKINSTGRGKTALYEIKKSKRRSPIKRDRKSEREKRNSKTAKRQCRKVKFYGKPKKNQVKREPNGAHLITGAAVGRRKQSNGEP